MGRNRTKALGKLYKKITNTELPTDANTTTEALQKVYEALTQDNKHHINVTDIIEDLAANWSGGGSGSLKTANVTFVMQPYTGTQAVSQITYPTIENGVLVLKFFELGSGTSVTVPVAINDAGFQYTAFYLSTAACGVESVEGSATVTENEHDDKDVLITGDCTITLQKFGLA